MKRKREIVEFVNRRNTKRVQNIMTDIEISQKNKNM